MSPKHLKPGSHEKDTKMHRIHISLMGLALVICTGTLHATNANLTISLATPVAAFTCNTTTGIAGSETFKITATGATSAAPVTVGIQAGTLQSTVAPAV